jgi:hypothetical protein
MTTHRSRAHSDPLGPFILVVVSRSARCHSDDVYTRLELLGMGLATLGLLLAILGPGPRRAGSPVEGRS